MKKLTGLLISLIIVNLAFISTAQEIVYPDSWGKQGFSIKAQRDNGLTINYSLKKFTINPVEIRGDKLQSILLPGHYLPNNEGAPDLPGSGRYIAIPNGANVTMKIRNQRIESIKDLDIIPAFRIPKESENQPLEFLKDTNIYSQDAFYPEQPVKLSEVKEIRGINSVILGVTPFQYNPVTKELIVYRDIEIDLIYEDGSAAYGEERLRSKWWDPVIKDVILNSDVLPEVNYSNKLRNPQNKGWEYVIIVPDDPNFIAWADTLKMWRIKQGIKSTVVTTKEIGGNTINDIQEYITDAYYTWDIPPAAILLLGDHGTSGNTITSANWGSYCISDHVYATIDNDNQADVAIARITARDNDELETMIMKIIEHEKDPPVDSGFYNNPITALGWQTERWFQICAETIGGYFSKIHDKEPVRINEIFDGDPSTDPWSVAPNTSTILNYFGPNGLDYIPESPTELGNWTGGNASMINNAINDGAFIIQHRDHGNKIGWGEPAYYINNLSGLKNEDLIYVFSINCLTGKFDYSDDCFAEVFHRHPHGALGLIAATETSFSFVNDTYTWGLYDHMWTDFLPEYGTNPETRGLLPAFGNIAGKYYLEQSSWPYNTELKNVTYYLFHHHGGAFSTLFSEMPQNLSVEHDSIVLAWVDYFVVKADEGSTIALTCEEEIIGICEANDDYQEILITAKDTSSTINLTVTKTNHFRYTKELPVRLPEGPYVIAGSYEFTDIGIENEQIDYGENIKLSLNAINIGTNDIDDIEITISSEDTNISINDNYEQYGIIEAQDTTVVQDGFSFEVAEKVPDEHTVIFTVLATNGEHTWKSHFSVMLHSPVLEMDDFTISDPLGNNNGKLDPGEVVNMLISINNTGSSPSIETKGFLNTSDEYINITQNEIPYGEIPPNNNVIQSYELLVEPLTPVGHNTNLEFSANCGSIQQLKETIFLKVGQVPILVLDFDPNNSSGPIIKNTIEEIGIPVEYTKNIPEAGLRKYNTIFVCLGIFSSSGTNHILSSQEGNDLAGFIGIGGKLYMEGGDTWFWDDPTAVHPFFRIYGADDGTGNLDTLIGHPKTFTDSLRLFYSGENDFIDQIEPLGSAFKVISNKSPNFGCAIAFDGTTYKTIGASFEFGGVEDGKYTKTDLMDKYLQFFEFTGAPAAPGKPEGAIRICNDDSSFTYFTHPVQDAEYYTWSVEPSEAGMAVGFDTLVTIDWNENFYDTAIVKVFGMNKSGPGELSEGLVVAVHPQIPLPDVNLGEDTTICSNHNIWLCPAPGYDKYLWNDGSTDDSLLIDSTGIGTGTKKIWVEVEDKYGCYAYDEISITFTDCQTIDEILADKLFKIYPNPSKGQLFIEPTKQLDDPVSFCIINTLGEKVLNCIQTDFEEGKFIIDLSVLNEGIYFVLAKSKNFKFYKKVVINN